MTVLTQHPLNAAVPPLPTERYQLLAEDIRDHGLKTQIRCVHTVRGDEVIDGWHRYRALLELGTFADTHWTHWKGDTVGGHTVGANDWVAWAIWRHADSRRLGAQDRAALALAVLKPRDTIYGRPWSGTDAFPGRLWTAQQIADVAHCSATTIFRMRRRTTPGTGPFGFSLATWRRIEAMAAEENVAPVHVVRRLVLAGLNDE